MRQASLQSDACVAARKLFLGFFVAATVAAWGPSLAHADEVVAEQGQGCLRIVDPDRPVDQPQVACPLKHTSVDANIAGYVGRTTVKQTFTNPTTRKIEAIYVFPMPNDAAVDRMTMIVGERRIVADIKEREEARQAYEAAKSAGHVASLLDQERPNIFTQSLANIEPGATVEIEISFVETLSYENGLFTWNFPMVVGPRYIPGGGSAASPMTTGRDTPRVPDGSRITPPVAPKGSRAGHDIDITVRLDGGSARMAPNQISSELHDIEQSLDAARGSATITLRRKNEIPNRDFVLRYRLGSDEPGPAFLTHRDERGEFFTLVLQPPRRVTPETVVPRELIFVLDTSGSMSGFPIEQAKNVMSRAIDALRPDDTFNLITFAGDTNILWDEPRPATKQNLADAQRFLADRDGGGGTEMMKAIDAALRPSKRITNFCGTKPRVMSDDRGPTDRGPGRMTSDLMKAEELAGLMPDGRSVMIELSSDQIVNWPPPNVRSTWSGVAVNTSRGPVELRNAPVGGDGAGRRNCAVRGTWSWSEDRDRGVLTIESVDWNLPSNASSPERDDAVVEGKQRPMRVVCFMTDGYVGNDMEIIAAVKNFADTTRVFSFGIGNSVNHFLLDEMAREGRGEVEYVSLSANPEAAVARFADRISAPVLADISIDWGGLSVSDVFPTRVPDLFAAKPIIVHGRLTGDARGDIRLRGQTGAGSFEQTISIGALERSGQRDSIASLWARAKVAHLLRSDYEAAQRGDFPAGLKAQIVALGLQFRLLTQFTSFVAVEEMTITRGGQPTTVRVPVEMPAGVSHEGVFGGAPAGGQGGMLFQGGALPTISGVPAPAPIGNKARKLAAPRSETGRVLKEASRDDAVDADAANSRVTEPAAKLDERLRDLANKVEREGREGDLEAGGVSVRNWRIDVTIELYDLGDATREALKNLGFEELAAGNAARVLIGSIDVRKLAALSELESVARVRPV
ncbi:MAG: VIT and VWA domain-containing protein [Phycisphaerae bacterium]|nr:VIT and VWA domain-containing protein [Phycisphaerae bacterium]